MGSSSLASSERMDSEALWEERNVKVKWKVLKYSYFSFLLALVLFLLVLFTFLLRVEVKNDNEVENVNNEKKKEELIDIVHGRDKREIEDSLVNKESKSNNHEARD